MGEQKPRRTRIKDDDRRETVVMPMVTLPTIRSVRVEREPVDDLDDDLPPGRFSHHGRSRRPPVQSERADYDGGWGDPDDPEEVPPPDRRSLQRYRADTTARPLQRSESKKPADLGSPRAARQYNTKPHPFEVFLVPGRKNLSRHLPPGMRDQVDRVLDQLDIVRRNKTLLVVLALVVVLTTTLVAVSNTTQVLGDLNQTAWETLSGQHDPPTPTPLPAPDITTSGHYVAKYGFDWPSNSQPLPGDERARIIFMLPYAYRAAAAYDRRYHNSIEPEMLVWWTHAEGIGARINYSNCANLGTPAGTTYFSDIENCAQSNFWQLGYGNQFSVIYVLKNAFPDIYGDPNNAALVQKVGQWVLNFDEQQGTVPACGGYSCTFPRLTIDQIMSGVDETSGVVTADNWWASVLSRDPAINCYMIAHALSFFNHAATLNWVGCYYYEPCWGWESNRLGDILAAWPGLRQAAHI